MTQQREGTVTILFTDVVGSTEQRQRLGDDAAEPLRRAHFQLLRRALAEHAGREIKTIGDSIMAEFASALDAARCAIEMQQAVGARNASEADERRLGLRVGMDAGEPAREQGDLFGTPVVVARRLCDLAAGGEIVASDIVRGLIGSRGALTFEAKGPLTLKGMVEPVAAHRVVWEAPAAAAEPPPVEAAALPLPAALGVARRTAFVGRGDELEALRAHWRAARDGGGQFVSLAGEPGIGKTRLASELARAAHEDGGIVLYGRCDEDALVAFQPFAGALRELASTRQVPEAVWELVQGIDPPAADEQRYRAAEGIAALLRGLSATAPILLVLDDAQWADNPSLALLRHVARAATPRLLLAVSYRADVGREHPLAAALADIRRERDVVRVAVGGLSHPDVAAMVGAWTGTAASAPFAQAVFEHTEGNPFFIEELLRHLKETGALRDEAGRVTADLTAARVALPEGVASIIGRRLARLSEACNSVLTVAAVIGRTFDVDALQRASDLDTAQLLSALDEAIEIGVVEEQPSGGSYAFAHSLIHEALYDELTTTRRVHLHGQTLRYADSSGVKLAYEVLGTRGPCVVAVGIVNCPAVRGRNLYTTRRWEPITRYARVLLYDRRGVGYSAAPERGYSLLAGVEDLRAVLDAAGTERAVVWGASDGGPMAITFAAQYPERTAALVLIGTTAKLTSSPEYAFGMNLERMQSFLATESVDQAQAAAAITRARRGANEDAIGEVFRRVPRRAWSKTIASLGMSDARDMMERVRAPALILHDPENAVIPIDAARYLHDGIAGSELVITEEAGQPLFGEELYRRVQEFIERAGARGALP